MSIGNLKVIVYFDQLYWNAIGLDIDYMATGKTLDGACQAFIAGFEATFVLHLERYGNTKNFLAAAPKQEWKMLWDIIDNYKVQLNTIPDSISQHIGFDMYCFISPQEEKEYLPLRKYIKETFGTSIVELKQ